MGLDMYLHAERYVSELFSEGDNKRAEKLKEMFPELSTGEIKIIRSEIGYWRKANQIHNWFVRNVQGGEDDCKNYYVSREQLKELLDIIQQVLADTSRAQELLPNTAGFFFGSQDYDEWYYQDLEQTVKIIERALALPDNLDLYYHSSW
jgi:hypothetical protein